MTSPPSLLKVRHIATRATGNPNCEMGFLRVKSRVINLSVNSEALFNISTDAISDAVSNLERKRPTKSRRIIINSLKPKSKMKKLIGTAKVFASLLLMGSMFCFVSCSDDDDNVTPTPDEVTTDVMFGEYSGKMVAASIATQNGEGEETPSGTDITATLDNDTIRFEDFPIRDIVLAIVQDETTADQIVEAVGQVGYAIGYEPTLAAEKDTVTFVLDPKPLTLAVQLPSDTEEEAQTLQIEVKVEAGAEGTYDVESGHIVFDFSATEVLLGAGEEQTPLEGFDGINLQFDMNQSKTKAHWL